VTEGGRAVEPERNYEQVFHPNQEPNISLLKKDQLVVIVSIVQRYSFSSSAN
jgi:hypothetical protein